MTGRLNNRTGSRTGRLLLCLLLAAVCLSQCLAPVGSAADREVLNLSGNRNTELSIDPARQSEGFSAVLYNNRNGLPTSEANAIAQTAEGFIWIGSYAGLIRYDGNTFERVSPSTGIANVRCLFVDSRDRIWIGTNDSGVFSMMKNSLQNWGKEQGLRSVSVRAVTEDENGLIYIGCAAGGVAMIDDTLKLRLLEDERLDRKTIWEFRPGPDGLVYGLTQDGDLFTLRDGAVVTFLGSEECSIKDVRSILPDPEHPGCLYVGTQDSEVCYGSMEANFPAIRREDIAPLYSATTMEYINGQIWICAENGIGRLGADGFRMPKNVPMSNSIEHVMTDHDGNLWFVSSRQGLMKIVPNMFSNLFERYELPSTVVNSTCLSDGKLFIGTDSGLIVMDGDRRLNRIPLTEAVTASGEELEADDLLTMLDGLRVRSIVRDGKGRLWISGWRKYLLCYDQGVVTAYTLEDGLFSNAVRAICTGSDGTVLTSGTGGVSVIQNGRVKASYSSEAGIVNEDILTVAEGFQGELILGSDGDGIYVIGPEGTRRIGTEDGLASDIILRLRRSRTQDLFWIVTSNSLAVMTPDYRVRTLRQFPYPNNYDIYESSSGEVWILSSAGIYIASAEDLLADGQYEPVFYSMQSGLPFAPTVNAYSELTEDGDLYIAGTEGVVKVNIETPFQDLSEMKIDLPYVEADGVRYYADESGRFTVPGNASKVTLYPFVFNYSLIDPQVSYRLDGFERTDETLLRSRLAPVDYTNLRIGAYTFIITVKDPTGHGAQSASFPIIKGKQLSAGGLGTIMMISSSLLLLGGLLIFNAANRKRARLEDRMFLSMILVLLAMAVGELLSFLLEFSTLPIARDMMILGNTVYYMALIGFPYLVLVYLEYRINPDLNELRKKNLLFGIPCLLMLLVVIINLETGWIFSIRDGNVFHAGRIAKLMFLPPLFYLLFSLVRIYRVNRLLALLGFFLLATRLALDLWFQSISSTVFIFTLILVCVRLHEMNIPMSEEAVS